MVLIYDGGCDLCRSLAFRIHELSRQPIELLSLRTAAAKAMLDRRYPNGWDWDFYLVSGRTFRKGPAAFPALLKHVGVRNAMALMRQYAEYNRARASCETTTVEAPGGRRELLRTAALVPLLAGLSRLPVAAAPRRQDGVIVNIAEIQSPDSVSTWTCPECVKPLGASSASSTQATASDTVMSAEERADLISRPLGVGADPDARNSLVTLTRTVVNIGRADGSRSSTLYAGGIVHPQYDVSLSFAMDRYASLAGVCRHNLPVPIVDQLVFTGRDYDVADHIRGYQNGLRHLANLHAAEGRDGLAEAYERMAVGFAEYGDAVAASVRESISPVSSRVLVTSMPDLLRFATLPDSIHEKRRESILGARAAFVASLSPDRAEVGAETGLAGASLAGAMAAPAVDASQGLCQNESFCSLGCCCGLGACWGCGCGLSACIPPIPFCGCGLCGGVGCGCGYCCSCDFGDCS